jgi:hypothetical protein
MDAGFGGNDDVTGGDRLFCPNFIEVVLPFAREDGPGVLASWMDVRGDGLAGFEVPCDDGGMGRFGNDGANGFAGAGLEVVGAGVEALHGWDLVVGCGVLWQRSLGRIVTEATRLCFWAASKLYILQFGLRRVSALG